LGLALALACFIPTLYWLKYETSYDDFYPYSENIYRIYSLDKQSGKINNLTSGILAKKLPERFASIENATVFYTDQNSFSTKEIPHVKLNTLITDSTFFSVFPNTIISGDTKNPLQINNNIVITKAIAIRLFGSVENAIGKQIKGTHLLENDSPYTVTAVIKNPPLNTNISFEAILSHEQIALQKSFVEKSGNEIWDYAFLQMFVKLHSNTDIHDMEEQLYNFPSQTYANENINILMMPICDIRHNLTQDAPFTIQFIYLILIAGALLVLSAIFNFTNLYFHFYYQRIHSFRLRHIHGASKRQIIYHIILEFTIPVLLAVLFCCFFLIITSSISSTHLSIVIDLSKLIMIFSICIITMLLIMVLIGFLLAYRLSRLAVKQGVEINKVRQSKMQHMVVNIQLSISIVFIVSTLVVSMQMHFINNKDLGFNQDDILYLSNLDPFINNSERTALLNELRSIPQIKNITDANFTPQHNINPFSLIDDVEWKGKSPTEKYSFNFITVDSQFSETFRVNMLQGKWLNESSQHAIVLNEEAVKLMGIKEPVGSTISMTLRNKEEYRIVGVVKDFHTLSLRKRIYPTIFITSNYPSNNYYIRTIAGQRDNVLKQVNTILSKYNNSLSQVKLISVRTLYEQLNYSEQTGLIIFVLLTIVLLLITLCGVYAIAITTTEYRRKEIAIRKAVGADIKDIIYIFFKAYIIQIGKASILAIPLAYLSMNRWLQEYSYHILIPYILFVWVVIGITFIVLTTILGQVLNAANSNPSRVFNYN